MNLLVIEDDKLFGSMIEQYLSDAGYLVDWIDNSQTARAVLDDSEQFDLVILDLDVPQLDWRCWLEKFRDQNQGAPVLVLSANNTTDTLDVGASQYLAKSHFNIEKLSSIIRALLRRSDTQTSSNTIAFKEITMNLDTREVMRDNVKFDLGRRQFDLLHKLLEQVNTVVPRDHLAQSMYGWDTIVSSNTLEVHISQLRWKLFWFDLRLISREK